MKPCLSLRFALPVACLVLLSAGNHRFYDLGQSADGREAAWVDSTYQALSETERLGQLITVRAHTDKDTAYENNVERLIQRYKVGGVCFFNVAHSGTVEKQAELTNRYQAASAKVPLFVSLDAEWGLGMRLRETTISYPRQMMLGAIRDNRLLYEMGREIARQCLRAGVNVSYSPVADVNNNAANPVINDRSFGEDRYNVAAKCYQYMMGLQDGGVLASAKHFPGHGDTNIDSHHEIPTLPYDRKRIDSLELFPFRIMAEHGIGSVMVGHLQVPVLDDREHRPASLSKPTISGILRDEMGYDGLIFTDAMEMRGVTKYYKAGEADVEALRAGVDMLLLPGDVGAALTAIQKALAEGTLDARQIENSIKRILRAKYRLGLTKPQRVELKNLRRDLNAPKSLDLKRRLIASALTLVRDRTELVGFENLEKFKFATLALGDTVRTVFQKSCALYAPMGHFNAAKTFTPEFEQRLLDSLSRADVVFVSLHNMRSYAADNFGLTETQINFIRRLCETTTVALTVFGNPYCLRYFDQAPILLEAYNEDINTQELAAQALFGAIDLEGTLPVTVSVGARYGQGLQKHWSQPRLGYALPESVGMSSDTLQQIDSLIRTIISTGAAPGAQVLVAKNNKIVWHKAYGYQTYEPLNPVRLDDLYDLASVTKVAATTISAMRLKDEGRFSLDSAIQAYIPELNSSNKKGLTLREIMAHHAALQAWIPFYQQTLNAQKLPEPAIYNSMASADFNVPVGPELYMTHAWVDSIWGQIFHSGLRPNKSYKYSDLGLYLTARSVKNISKIPVDVFADQWYYKPLGMSTTMFNPWQHGLTMRCAPTEEDHYFRQRRIQGYVHDMGAAMLGGVSGHAGLFSSANDLAKLFQMLLNGGTYFGRRYLETATIREFTTRYPLSSRRGIGFDLKELDPKESMNMSELAGPNTFGHLGFTGTCVWADPDQNLIFIFLSNRTYPTMENNKLSQENYRPRLQSIVYKSLAASKAGLR